MTYLRSYRIWLTVGIAFLILVCATYVLWPRVGPHVRDAWHTVTNPRIVCDETMHHFGDVPTGGTVTHNFSLRNDGWQTLEITDVRSDCACAVARPPEKTIPPGKSISLTATLSLKGLRGPQRKNIVVSSNDPKRKHLELTLQGVAATEIELNPAVIDFGMIREDSPAPYTLDIAAPKSNPPLRVLKVLSSNQQLIDARSETGDGKTHRLHVTLKGPLPRAQIRESITVRTNLSKEPEIIIPVTGQVIADLMVEPDKIVLASRNEPVGWWLAVKPGRVQKFKIRGVEVPVPSMQAEVSPTTDNKGFRIRLSNIVPTSELQGKKLRIKTDVKGMEEIAVPFEIVTAAAGGS
jgi:uncharacterized protein DUF1573